MFISYHKIVFQLFYSLAQKEKFWNLMKGQFDPEKFAEYAKSKYKLQSCILKISSQENI